MQLLSRHHEDHTYGTTSFTFVVKLGGELLPGCPPIGPERILELLDKSVMWVPVWALGKPAKSRTRGGDWSRNTPIQDRRQNMLRNMLMRSNPTKDDCWEWTGTNNAGYPLQGWLGGRHHPVKVLALLLAGTFGTPNRIHRLCDNRRCVFPRHYQIDFPHINVPLPIIPRTDSGWSIPGLLPWQQVGLGSPSPTGDFGLKITPKQTEPPQDKEAPTESEFS